MSFALRAAGENLVQLIRTGKLHVIAAATADEYNNVIASSEELQAIFEPVVIAGLNEQIAGKQKYNGYRGDNVSADLRQMMQDDPSGNKRVDVILQAKDADNASLRAILRSGEARISGRISGDDTLVVNMPLSTVNSLSQSGTVNYISPNRAVSMSGHLEATTGTTGMRSQPSMNGRPAYTLDGSGVGIAVLDSGIYSAHNAFKNSNGASRIVANVNFTNSNPNDTADGYGHGTHVAAIAAGNQSINGGAYRGIAPNANIISLKVLNSSGQGQMSWVLGGLNWVLQNREAYNIRVVNLSIGSLAIDSYANDPVCIKVRELANAGIMVVAAAGNVGKSSNGTEAYGGIHSPGNSPYALTVGASNSFGTVGRSDDGMASYSSHGPTRSFYTRPTGQKVFDNLIKPDLVAPGNKIVSAKAINNAISLENPLLNISLGLLTSNADAEMAMSGTSMSAPVVSGAAALLLQVNPNLTPGMIKTMLEYTAQPIAGADNFEQGGRTVEHRRSRAAGPVVANGCRLPDRSKRNEHACRRCFASGSNIHDRRRNLPVVRDRYVESGPDLRARAGLSVSNGIPK